MLIRVDELFTREEEKYLAVLYRTFELGKSRVSTTELSEKLRLHPSTVSNKLKSLKNSKIEGYPIIDYEKSYGVKLTFHGKIIAGKIIRKIRIKELFLKSINYNLVEIEELIDDLHMSERVANQINKMIIDPLMPQKDGNWENIRCPHGALIPDENGYAPPEEFYPLKHYPADSDLTIHRITLDRIEKFQQVYCREILGNALFPGTKIRNDILQDEEIRILNTATHEEFTISNCIASQLYCTDHKYEYNIPC